MNSTDAAYRRDNFMLEFLDSACVPKQSNYTQQDIDDCNDAICEYECLIQHAIDSASIPDWNIGQRKITLNT